MNEHIGDGTSLLVIRAELNGKTRAEWKQLTRAQQERILELDFVRRYSGHEIFFDAPYPEREVAVPLKHFLRKYLNSADISFYSSAEQVAKSIAGRLERDIKDSGKFHRLSFGADVAEQDTDLLKYFIDTRAFKKANDGTASVIIGPKGSGKTAILRAIQGQKGRENTIVITPEVFATNMLQQVMDDSGNEGEENQALTSTWIFSILVEVFKRISTNPRGVQQNTLKKLRGFLAENTDYQDLDLFTRFVRYLKKIESVRHGDYDLIEKTKRLQDMYLLSKLYEIVPGLRSANTELFILLDELDFGWDNSKHANKFVASLLQAAIKVQYLGLKARVVTFLRSEIFDLIKYQLDHLDKLRSSMEVIKWSDGELADLIARRVAYSLSTPYSRTGHEIDIASALFEGSHGGMPGFVYVLSRTSLRPREVLQFISHAHRISVDDGKSSITPESLAKAEEDFSSWKSEYVCTEYKNIYPDLKDLIEAFRAEGPVMSRLDIADAIQRYTKAMGDSRPLWTRGPEDTLVQVLFNIGFLGIPRPQAAKNRTGIVAQYEFVYERAAANLRAVQSYLIHPAFWVALEVPT